MRPNPNHSARPSLTATGKTLGENLDRWEKSERRTRFRQLLKELDGVDANEAILASEQAKVRGLTNTLISPRGNLAPEGLAGGPIGKALDGDVIRIQLDCRRLEGTVDLVGEGGRKFTP